MKVNSKITIKKYLRKSLKIFAWFFVSLISLFFLTLLVIQIPAVQNFAKNKAVTYLEGKIKTKVSITKIDISFPKKVVLEGVCFQDENNDTLFAGKKLAVDISLFKLLDNVVELNSVDLEGITATISRDKDAIFNFDYIIKAFATQEKVDTTAAPIEFSVDKINLDNIKFKFNDAITGNNIAANINHFDTNIKTFDLNKMTFEIPKAKLNGLKFKLKQGIAIPQNKSITNKTSSENDLKIKINELELSKIDIDYENDISNLSTKISLEKLLVSFNEINLQKELIDIKSLAISYAKGNLKLGKIEKIVTKNNLTSTPTSSNWKVKIDDVNLQKIDFKFDDESAVATNKGMDYMHLDIKEFNLNANDINYSKLISSGKINSFTVNDKSGLDIQALKTDFVYYDNKGVSLKNLYLKTPRTEVRNELIIGYPSVESIQENLGEMSIKANLKNSKIAFRDILLFAPTLKNTSPFDKNKNAILSINSQISGKIKDIFIPNLQVSGIGSTRISASGRIVGLPDVNKAYFDLNIKNLESTSKDIYSFAPKGSIPNTIEIPNQLATKGTFKGTINNFTTNLNLVSSFGNAKIKATFDQRTKNQEKYNAQTEFENFDLGKLIKNKSIGKITLKADVKGSSLNPKNANAIVDGIIKKANFNNYTYQNIKLNGKINKGIFNLKANANDPNLVFDLVSSGKLNDKYPTGKLNLNIDIADLNKLNLHAGVLKLRGSIDADFQSLDLENLNGKVISNKFIIANEKEQFLLDSISIIAISNADKNSISLKSQFANANIEGDYKLLQIGNALQNSFSNYYNINSKKSKIASQKQQFTFGIDIKDSPILFKLISDLKSLEPVAISGSYNSVNDSIVIKGSIPRVVYGENKISGALLKVDTKDNALVYSLVVDDIQNPNLQLPHINFYGKVEKNTVDYTLQLKDLKDIERYLIAGTLKSNGGISDINLNPTNLLLNYEKWNLSEENLIRYSENGIFFNDFNLNKSTNSIQLQSESQSQNAPLSIDFKDFEIETLTNIASKSDLQIGGKINGNALLKDLQTVPLFTSNLLIDNFTFQKEPVGNLKINIDNNIASTYNAKIELKGFDNQVNLDGNYKTLTSSFEFNLDIKKLNVKSIQGFSIGNITESTGFLNGDLKITGTADKPRVVGELQFNEVGFKAKQLNAKFKSINEKIVFSNNTIIFDTFKIKDEKDNDLIVDGIINSEDFTNLGFDLTVVAKNFKAINSKAKDNDSYYGELFLDNNLQIKGTMKNPIVEGNIKVNKDTKFTIVLPQSDPSIADREGIVEFIDQDQPQLITTIVGNEEMSKSEVKGINASVNIEIDKEAELSIIIDKANGDYLKLKGEAQLNGGIDPSGKTTLTGRYEFTDGSYEMNFNLIKRKFDIKSGSYILWTGEPTMADVNITAVYKSETAPIDLVDDQLGGRTVEERNTFKQKIPFETQLKMNGELLKPVISFDIVLPAGNNDVSTDIINTTQAKLTQLRQQPDELNKQVFALLLLNRFIGENPFSSESGGTTTSALARESASKILSQQLNNLAGDLINGVEINFNLEATEDYTSGQKEDRTDLNVSFSKKLVNDRLKVTVGSSFGIEGAQQDNQQASTIAGDVALDYQLTKDGRYKVRAYRVNKYQVALQGQVIETGVAFIITMDYNKFSELFKKSASKKIKIKKNKEAKQYSDEKK